MVQVRRPDEPPALQPRNPMYAVVPVGTELRRVFDPTDHGATPLGFRYWGPTARFDHHLGMGPPGYQACTNTDRAVYYTAFTLSGCVVEVCGDDGVIEPRERSVVHLRTQADLTLLDLRGSGAMRVGSVAALAKIADRAISQAWARHLYAHPAIDPQTAGLLYSNAHNDEKAIVLFERAEGVLALHPQNPVPVRRLDDLWLRPHLQQIARDNNLAMF